MGWPLDGQIPAGISTNLIVFTGLSEIKMCIVILRAKALLNYFCREAAGHPSAGRQPGTGF